MSTNSIPTMSKITVQTNSTTELYDSLFQILSTLSSYQPHDIPFDSLTKYNLLIKSSNEASKDILEEIEHQLIYSQADCPNSLDTIKKLLTAISGLKKLDDLTLKSVNTLLLASVNSSRSSFSSYLENEEEEEDIDFGTLYRDVSDSLMRIKLDLINWDTETECESSEYQEKLYSSFVGDDDLFDLELEL